MDVRRVHEHLDADASGPGAVQLGLQARLRRRLRRDDPGHRPGGVGLRPRGRHLDIEGLHRSVRPDGFGPGGVLGLRPGHGPGRRRGSGVRRGTRQQSPSAAALDLRRRHRHVDADPPGQPASPLGSRCGLRLRRLGRQVDRVRRLSIHGAPGRDVALRPPHGRLVEGRRRHAADRGRMGDGRVSPGDGLRRSGKADPRLRPWRPGRLRCDRGSLGEPERDRCPSGIGPVRRVGPLIRVVDGHVRLGERTARRPRRRQWRLGVRPGVRPVDGPARRA